ncbi:PREDICTED: uncharacterized protein LOC108762160 [Trachymyrmex cornetzi]|uniref:uncharacterized protein LOC108762160 n=1 Tax=Trachymyrmex cornetzi TaxID=471704 RepID=UPI00084F0183|nr:PREDICTED: uncharacterized protein LOC108762160 [Trachymyrmex cornetzi]
MGNEYEKSNAAENKDNFEEFSNSSSDSDRTLRYSEPEEEMEKMPVMTKFYNKLEKNVMMSVEQAIDVIKAIVCENKNYKVNIQTVNTIDAYNRVLAIDVFSTIERPSCRTSAKHGYAMLASNGVSGKDIRKVLKAHPMFAEISVVPGTCVRVRNGDPIPNGANTVVTPENIKILDERNDNDNDYFNIDDKEYEIEVLVAPKVNENIRSAGYLIKRNEYIMKRFKRIRSSELGILTLCGIDTIPVIEVLSIGVLTIGSRFEESENTLTLGRIYESNRIILTSLLKENGYNLTNFGISAYRLDAIIKKIKDALNKVDVLVIMGPVNDKDILKAILREHFSAYIYFGCLDMKPGKSTMFASCTYNCKKKFFLCMSTNPVTVPIVAYVVLLPFLNTLHRDCSTPIVMQICIKNHELHLRPKFSWTIAQWTEDETFPRAYCSKNQHHNIMKYQKANALLRLPKYTSEVPKLDAAFVPTEPICGIRNKKLIINMCGPLCENAIMSLMTSVTLILEIVHLMNMQDEEICSIKNDDTFDKMFNTNNNDDNSDKVFLHSASENETKNISIQNLFKRQKQTIMMSVKDASHTMRKILDDECGDHIEIVETNNAYGRILADHIESSEDVPFYDTSTKHGYAVLVSDGKSKRRVLKAHLTFADISVVPGTCVRVRSGDPIPNGATAVVTLANTKVLEECSDNDDDYFNINYKEYEIEVLVAPKKNENIRNAGYELEKSQIVLQMYNRIGSVELGILKLCGINSVPVIKIPSVGLLSIGDKSEEPGYTSTLKRIYDCNSITLISLLKENGYNPVDLGISAYQLKVIIKNIKYALDKVNVLVIMGHANDNDLLKPILREYFNAVIHFGRVEMKPGKSTTFATCIFNHKMKFFLCMSANPATIPIVAHIFLLPFLNSMHFDLMAYEPKPNIQTCIMTTHELHRRPKFSWTTLHWSEKETFSRACCSKKQHQNILKYQKANALLMLPQCTPYQSKIDAAFVPAMLLD